MANTTEWKTEYKNGRPMSELEVIMDQLHQAGMWVLLRTLAVSYEEKPSMEQVNDALKAVMRWNPSLRVIIQQDSNGVWEFCEQPEAKPRLECFYNEDNWHKVMENELLRPLDSTKAPHFKCIYLPNALHNPNESNTCTFVFVFNHAIIDGMSTIATLRKFRFYLNEVVQGRKPKVETSPSMHPPSDYHILRAFNQLPDEKKKYFEALPPFAAKDAVKPCLWVEKVGVESKKNPSIPPAQGLTIGNFTEEEVKALRSMCRKNGTTIQAVAQVAGAVAIAKLMQDPKKENWEPLTIKLNLAMNLRPHIAQEVSVEYTGVYMSVLFGFETEVSSDIQDGETTSEEFWKLARESRDQIIEQVKDKKYLESYFVFNGLSERMEELANMTDPKAEGRYEELVYTTSYGAWEFPSDVTDTIKPLMVYSNSSVHISGPVFSQQLMTMNGKMSWTVGWSKRAVSQETADKFADLMFGTIRKIIKSN